MLARITNEKKILVVSVPKAGTHLLLRTLNLFPQFSLSGYDLVGKPIEQQLAILNILQAGQIANTHAPPKQEYLDNLRKNDFKVIFILRDPRDVCVSLFHWFMYIDINNTHRTYFASLKDDNERLLATIVGMEENVKKTGSWWDGIDCEFRKRIPWGNYPDCLVIKFEDLIGSKGGGDDLRERETIEMIARHLDIRLKEKRYKHIVSNLYGKTTTFRKGQIGDWRNYFEPYHVDIFKNVAGKLLIELGYEHDLNW